MSEAAAPERTADTKETCKHDFECRLGVAMFEDKPGQGSLEITGKCRHCGVPLVFYGPRGSNAPYPVISPDRTELRAPVTFGYAPKFQPGPTVLLNGLEIVPVGGNYDA